MFPSEAYKTLKTLFPTCRMSGSDFVAVPCPTCDPADRKKHKRCVNSRNLSSHCFICERRLTWEELTEGAAFPDIRRHEDEPPALEKKPHPYARILPCVKEPTPVNQLAPDHPAVKFLNKDHIFDLDRLYADYGVVWCPPECGMVLPATVLVTSSERLIFPVTFKNELVGWQMRSIPGTTFGDRVDTRRYYFLFPKGKYLYGYDIAKKYPLIVVTEGVKKAWKFPCGVSTFGKGISNEQKLLMQEWPNIMLMLDGEDNTQESAQRLAFELSTGTNIRVVNVDPRNHGFHSPDEMTEEQAQTIMQEQWTLKHGNL